MVSLFAKHPERAWSQGKFTEPHAWDSVMAVIVSHTDDHGLEVIGNAIIIKDNENSAVCLTAAHNFEFAKQRRQRKVEKAHPTLPPDFKYSGTEYLQTDGLFALFSDGERHVGCTIGQICYVAGYDVAVFTIHAEDQKNPLFRQRFALDLGMPSVGDEIAMLAYDLSQEPIDVNKGHIRRALYLLFGKVTHIEFELGRLGQMTTFQTTIPVKPGMSGSPFLSLFEKGKPASVCGLASHDFSTVESQTKFAIAGCSTAAAIWPSWGLALNLEADCEEPGWRYLSTFAEKKWLDVRDNSVSVDLVANNENLVLDYVDQRVAPPIRGRLAMNHHPQLKPKDALR